MEKINNKYHRAIILFCPILIIILFIGQMIYLSRFNSQEFRAHGEDDTQTTYMSLGNREDSTSVWLKRDFNLNGQILDLRGQTIDGVVHNNSMDLVGEWSLRINIQSFCYINNSWCGTVTIHQNVGTENEAVQTLDLRNYALEEVELDYFYDGDLLIPLQKGDYVEYTPSRKESEYPVPAESEVTVGMIFYFPDDSELTDYTLTYSYHRTITDGVVFYVILLMLAIWLMVLLLDMISKRIYESAQHELELKKSGISSMSDMYDLIYIVDLIKNEIVSVVAETESELKRPTNMGADQMFRNLFEYDAKEAFKPSVLEFTDLLTLRERMEGKKNISCEYVSRNKGWCRLYFFAMDYMEDRPVDKVVFTLQIIEDERREMYAIRERISQAEIERREMGGNFYIFSSELSDVISDVVALDRQLIDAVPDAAMQNRIRESGRMINHYGKLLSDFKSYNGYIISNKPFAEREYYLTDVIDEVEAELRECIDESRVQLIRKCPQNFTGKLVGIADLVTSLMKSLVFDAAFQMISGEITLSVFTKEQEGKLHILISVISQGEKRKPESRMLRLKLVDRFLMEIGSKLGRVQSEANREEVFFEIDQTVGD